MNIMFDEQQAMTMALNISGNHVMCLDLKANRVYDLHGKAMFGNNVGIEVCYNYVHPDDCEKFRSFMIWKPIAITAGTTTIQDRGIPTGTISICVLLPNMKTANP